MFEDTAEKYFKIICNLKFKVIEIFLCPCCAHVQLQVRV